MINFRLMDNKNVEEVMNVYSKAYTWDKEKKCFLCNQESIDELSLSQNYAMYDNHDLIGYGSVTPVVKNLQTYMVIRRKFRTFEKTPMDKIGEACIIIHPDYRNQGCGNKLLQHLIQESKINYESMVAYIVTNNLPSISLVRKHDFEFRCRHNKENFYEKKLFLI